MESFWLAESLWYWYLIFGEPDEISLDDYVLYVLPAAILRPLLFVEEPSQRVHFANAVTSTHAGTRKHIPSNGILRDLQHGQQNMDDLVSHRNKRGVQHGYFFRIRMVPQ